MNKLVIFIIGSLSLCNLSRSTSLVKPANWSDLSDSPNTLLNYSPDTCTITNYDFTFIYDQTAEVFKVHGLWPEACIECEPCGYPSCCNINSINYVYPNDPTNFISNNWFSSTGKEYCLGKEDVILFEREYYKHISCTNLKTTDEFLELIIYLYNNYWEKYVENSCEGFDQLWINLDQNYNYNGTRCV